MLLLSSSHTTFSGPSPGIKDLFLVLTRKFLQPRSTHLSSEMAYPEAKYRLLDDTTIENGSCHEDRTEVNSQIPISAPSSLSKLICLVLIPSIALNVFVFWTSYMARSERSLCISEYSK